MIEIKAGPAALGAPAYSPPKATSHFIDGPGMQLAQRYCLTCHSADYVSTQPPAFWQGKSTRCGRTTAHIPDDAVQAITDDLVSAYTEPSGGH